MRASFSGALGSSELRPTAALISGDADAATLDDAVNSRPEPVDLDPEVEEAAESRVEWMRHHLTEARSPHDLREHFELQAAKAREMGDKLETAINVEAAVKVINAVNGSLAELRRRQVAWRALRMKSSSRNEVSTRPATRARESRPRRRAASTSSSGGGDPPDGESDLADLASWRGFSVASVRMFQHCQRRRAKAAAS